TAATIAEVDYSQDFLRHLEHFSEHRFPNNKTGVNHEKAKEYIKNTLEYHGLKTELQNFSTTVAPDNELASNFLNLFYVHTH
ncbi:hypothetical protein SK128_013912, partial [Halocaridina rubra]